MVPARGVRARECRKEATMRSVTPWTVLLGLCLLGACAPDAGGPGTVQADQTIGSSDDSLASEMSSAPQASLNDDVTGTPIPAP